MLATVCYQQNPVLDIAKVGRLYCPLSQKKIWDDATAFSLQTLHTTRSSFPETHHLFYFLFERIHSINLQKQSLTLESTTQRKLQATHYNSPNPLTNTLPISVFKSFTFFFLDQLIKSARKEKRKKKKVKMTAGFFASHSPIQKPLQISKIIKERSLNRKSK